MRLYSLNTAALVLIVLGLVVPTGATFVDDGQDVVWDDEGIVLSPHDGPNGHYAEIGDDGNLSVDLSAGKSLNADAVTTVDGVFDVTNQGSDARRVWITHDATDHVEFYASDVGEIQGSEQAVTLEEGETLVVGLVADTRGVAAGTQLLSSLTIHAQRVSTPTTTAPPTTAAPVGGGGSGGNATPTPTPTETPTETPTTTAPPEDEETVEVEFSVQVDDGQQATVRTLDDVPEEEDTGPPRVVIERVEPETEDSDQADPGQPSRRPRDTEDQTLTQVEEEVTLSGAQSTVGSVEAADRGRTVAKVVDITVPPGQEDQPATIRMRIQRSRLGDSDLSTARVARKTDDGWQLLPTRIESQSDSHVTFRARTPGFSVFAVLASNDVTYNWELEGKGTYAGEELSVSWDEPGIYNATLTVTDALGRTASRDYRVLVNDEPTVSIERPDAIQPGEPVTLRANVTDEFGNVTVRWAFEDGITATGHSVTRTFDRGEHVVRVTVVDEYDATGSAKADLVVGQPTTSPAIDVVRYALGFEGRLVLVAALAIVLLALSRRVFGRRR